MDELSNRQLISLGFGEGVEIFVRAVNGFHHTPNQTTREEISGEAGATLEKMLDDRRRQLSSCERMLELLQPEWDRFQAKSGHDTYVARDYADHKSAARRHRKEIAALEHILQPPTDREGDRLLRGMVELYERTGWKGGEEYLAAKAHLSRSIVGEGE